MAYTTLEQNLIDHVKMAIAHSTEESSVYVLPRRLADGEIYAGLERALMKWNATPPRFTTHVFTDFDTNGAVEGLKEILILGGELWATYKIIYFEAGKHFSVSDSGHTFTRDRSQKFLSILQQKMNEYLELLKISKKMYLMGSLTPLGQFSATAGMPLQLDRALRGVRKWNKFS